MRKLLFLTFLFYSNSTFNTETSNNLYSTLSTKVTNIKNIIKPQADKILNSKWLMPSLITTAATMVIYCNYASYRDYQQLKLIPLEDRIAATDTFAQFLIKTIFNGRQSYQLNALPEPYVGLSNELIRGYDDIIRGNSSFILTDNQTQAFKLLCGLPLKACVGLFGSIAFLNAYKDQIHAHFCKK